MSRTFRFIHLSDIHFGQEGGSIYGLHQSVRREIIRDCKERFGPLGKADGILINGDVAFSGTKEQFALSAEWIEELAVAVGCSDQTDVRVIPGNHDVDRSQIDYFCNAAHERLREIDTDKLDRELAEMAKAKEESNPLLCKLRNYRVFASRYGCDFNPVERLSWRKTYEFDANHRFDILGLTSVLVCDANDAKDAKDKMILGSNQYVIERVDDVEFFVMVHHPLAWFKDQPDAQRYLDRARVILTGHEHMQRVQKETSLTGDEFLRVYAGAANPPETSGAYPYRYSWLAFELLIEGDRQFIRVTIYPRVWEHNRTEFIADHNLLNSTGECAAFDLFCPSYKKPPAAAMASPNSSGTGLHVAKEGVVNENCNAQDIQRLQYFFWRYLDDWQIRIRILVDLDLLPDTKNQPVPHTLERLALDRANTTDKLHALWAAVMTHVPDQKRKPNPFPESARRK